MATFHSCVTLPEGTLHTIPVTYGTWQWDPITARSKTCRLPVATKDIQRPLDAAGCASLSLSLSLSLTLSLSLILLMTFGQSTLWYKKKTGLRKIAIFYRKIYYK